MIRKIGQIGIAVFVMGMLSCKSSPAPITTANPAPSRPALPKDENGDVLPMPEIVHARQVHIGEVKTVIVGNDNGEYTLFCNTKASNCLTPVPAKDYYVFNSNTKWKMPGATGYITLKWMQDWTITYNKAENIALVPAQGGTPDEAGMYGLSSWKAADKK